MGCIRHLKKSLKNFKSAIHVFRQDLKQALPTVEVKLGVKHSLEVCVEAP